MQKLMARGNHVCMAFYSPCLNIAAPFCVHTNKYLLGIPLTMALA